MMSLLLMADPNEQKIRDYLKGSSILIATDANILMGIAVLSKSDDTYELINIAVHERYQGKGIAKNLIMEIKSLAKKQGTLKLIVGTGNSSISQLALYQKCGFRMSYVKTNYFASYPEPIFENGIRCIDMIVLCAEL